MEFTVEDIAEKASSMGVVARVNSPYHVTLFDKQRTVQIWTSGKVFSEYVPQEWKRFKTRSFHPIHHAVEKAVELAKEGYICE